MTKWIIAIASAFVLLIVGIAACSAPDRVARGFNDATSSTSPTPPLPTFAPSPTNPPPTSPTTPLVRTTTRPAAPRTTTRAAVSYASCADVWRKLGRPIHRGEPGFRLRFDADFDGVGCERRP